MAEADVMKGLSSILTRVCTISQRLGKDTTPRLVAVSKTKPKDMIISAYQYGQRNFGENYIQELVEKSQDSEVRQKCEDVKWHFIGHLQRNKISKLVSVPGLYVVETIDSEKLASALDAGWSKLNKPERLNVMIQINTSKEKEKSGCSPSEVVTVVKHVIHQCPHLNFFGLMTIGMFGYDLSLGPNPDFQCLVSCRKKVCEELDLRLEDVELSMGMSDDFEHAIEMGSTNVRVGSSIFGYREKKEATTNMESLSAKMEQVGVD